MSVLDRPALDDSPLADLHAIASELSIDGYRRLRRPALIDAILDKQEGGDGRASEAPDSREDNAQAEPAARVPRTRPSRRRSPKPAAVDGAPPAADDQPVVAEPSAGAPDDAAPLDAGPRLDDDSPAEGESRSEADGEGEDGAPAPRRRRGRRGGRTRTSAREETPTAEAPEQEEVRGADRDADQDAGQDAGRGAGQDADRDPGQGAEEEIVEGVVELLANGSGFVRVDPPEPSDDDVYVSAAQVKRCELVSGDRVAGPKRAPRRSERFASLVRIDRVNDRPALELADGVRFDDLPAALPSDRFPLGSEDPTVKAIEWLTPFGRGSRVTITGPARAGKSEALRRLAEALAGQPDLTMMVVLVGVRPEEVSEWNRGPINPSAGISFAASAEAQANTIEPVIDQARRLTARGADVVVLVDTLDGLHEHAARKTLAAARNIVDGGSLTVIATASAAVGGETTVIALDVELASTGRFPALDLVASGTIRPELLVGEAGAEAIARARTEAGQS